MSSKAIRTIKNLWTNTLKPSWLEVAIIILWFYVFWVIGFVILFFVYLSKVVMMVCPQKSSYTSSTSSLSIIYLALNREGLENSKMPEFYGRYSVKIDNTEYLDINIDNNGINIRDTVAFENACEDDLRIEFKNLITAMYQTIPQTDNRGGIAFTKFVNYVLYIRPLVKPPLSAQFYSQPPSSIHGLDKKIPFTSPESCWLNDEKDNNKNNLVITVYFNGRLYFFEVVFLNAITFDNDGIPNETAIAEELCKLICVYNNKYEETPPSYLEMFFGFDES